MDLDSNLFWCIISIVCGAFVSFISGYIFYFLGKNRKRIFYNINTTSITSNKVSQIKNLNIKYNLQEINNLYSSTITIKNIGNTMIERQDFALEFPISFITDGQFFIDENGYAIPSKNVRQLGDINKYSNVCRCVTLNFDYIPKKGTLTCSLFHAGNIYLESKLKDGKISRVTILSVILSVLISIALFSLYMAFVFFLLFNL